MFYTVALAVAIVMQNRTSMLREPKAELPIRPFPTERPILPAIRRTPLTFRC